MSNVLPHNIRKRLQSDPSTQQNDKKRKPSESFTMNKAHSAALKDSAAQNNGRVKDRRCVGDKGLVGAGRQQLKNGVNRVNSVSSMHGSSFEESECLHHNSEDRTSQASVSFTSISIDETGNRQMSTYKTLNKTVVVNNGRKSKSGFKNRDKSELPPTNRGKTKPDTFVIRRDEESPNKGIQSTRKLNERGCNAKKSFEDLLSAGDPFFGSMKSNYGAKRQPSVRENQSMHKKGWKRRNRKDIRSSSPNLPSTKSTAPSTVNNSKLSEISKDSGSTEDRAKNTTSTMAGEPTPSLTWTDTGLKPPVIQRTQSESQGNGRLSDSCDSLCEDGSLDDTEFDRFLEDLKRDLTEGKYSDLKETEPSKEEQDAQRNSSGESAKDTLPLDSIRTKSLDTCPEDSPDHDLEKSSPFADEKPRYQIAHCAILQVCSVSPEPAEPSGDPGRIEADNDCVVIPALAGRIASHESSYSPISSDDEAQKSDEENVPYSPVSSASLNMDRSPEKSPQIVTGVVDTTEYPRPASTEDCQPPRGTLIGASSTPASKKVSSRDACVEACPERTVAGTQTDLPEESEAAATVSTVPSEPPADLSPVEPLAQPSADCRTTSGSLAPHIADMHAQLRRLRNSVPAGAEFSAASVILESLQEVVEQGAQDTGAVAEFLETCAIAVRGILCAACSVVDRAEDDGSAGTPGSPVAPGSEAEVRGSEGERESPTKDERGVEAETAVEANGQETAEDQTYSAHADDRHKIVEVTDGQTLSDGECSDGTSSSASSSSSSDRSTSSTERRTPPPRRRFRRVTTDNASAVSVDQIERKEDLSRGLPSQQSQEADNLMQEGVMVVVPLATKVDPAILSRPWVFSEKERYTEFIPFNVPRSGEPPDGPSANMSSAAEDVSHPATPGSGPHPAASGSITHPVTAGERTAAKETASEDASDEDSVEEGEILSESEIETDEDDPCGERADRSRCLRNIARVGWPAQVPYLHPGFNPSLRVEDECVPPAAQTQSQRPTTLREIPECCLVSSSDESPSKAAQPFPMPNSRRAERVRRGDSECEVVSPSDTDVEVLEVVERKPAPDAEEAAPAVQLVSPSKLPPISVDLMRRRLAELRRRQQLIGSATEAALCDALQLAEPSDPPETAATRPGGASTDLLHTAPGVTASEPVSS